MASFNNPRGIAVDKAGNVFVGDVANQKIRKISSSGAVSTLSGSGAPGSQDHTYGLLAGFYFPNGLAVDEVGDLFVADALNNKIRIVELKGYSISPELLPAGLQFDRIKGVFTGTPTESIINSMYNITAYNVYGSSSTNLGISVSSQPGNALSFDGFDDKIIIPDATSLRSPVVSLELWVNVHTLTTRFGRMILKRNDMPGYDDSYSLGVDSLFRFTATMCSGTGTVEGQRFAYQKEPLDSGRWYFVSAVFSKDSVRLFVNGVHQQSTYTGYPIGHGKSALYFGFDERMAFSMDEVRIFNTDRSAFFSEDMCNTLSPETEGLTAYYNFNIGRSSGENKNATNLFDLTDHRNNGTLIGFQLEPGDLSNWTESYAMVIPVAKDASSISDQGFVVNWEKPRFGEVNQYLLDVSNDPGFHSFVKGYHQLPIQNYSHLIKGLAPNTLYYYRISAEGALFNGRGKHSNIVSVKTNH